MAPLLDDDDEAAATPAGEFSERPARGAEPIGEAMFDNVHESEEPEETAEAAEPDDTVL
jgi:hypothetical protein